MATTNQVNKAVTDTIQCPICHEVMNIPKMLPGCCHTFCLGCLDKWIANGKSGDVLICPVCNNAIQMPRGGTSKFQSNFYLMPLIDAQTPMETNLTTSVTSITYSQEELKVELEKLHDLLCRQVSVFENRCHDHDEQFENFTKHIDEVEQNIKEAANKKHHEIKRMIEKHTDRLMDETDRYKQKNKEEIETKKICLQSKRSDLEDMKKNCLKVLQEMSCENVAEDGKSAAHTLLDRAKELTNEANIVLQEMFQNVWPDFVESNEMLIDENDPCNNLVGKLAKSTKNRKNATYTNWIIPIGNVKAVTILTNELFLLQEKSTEIQVYDSETLEFKHKIRVPGLKFPWDIAASNCVLIVSEATDKLIHRLRLDHPTPEDTVRTWPIRSQHLTLSIMANCNLLITCPDLLKLIEYAIVSGSPLREFRMDRDLVGLQHGIHLSDGQFIICHASAKPLNRVCLVSTDGTVITSFGRGGKSKDSQLDLPNFLSRPMHADISISLITTTTA